MDAVDRALLNRLQEGLPLERDPYGALAAETGIPRTELLDRIRRLTASGHIRRLGGVFDAEAMGRTGVLVGAEVPEEIFREVAAFVGAIPGVTHNYRRPGFLNMWFTLTTESDDDRDRTLLALRTRFGLTRVIEFPRIRSFKLRVFFDMEGE